MKPLAELMKLFADPTRLRMVWLLSRLDEACVCDIERVLGISQSTASRHLRYLRDAGLVDNRRQNQWSYHRLVPQAEDPKRRMLRAVIEEAGRLPEAEILETRLREWLAAKKKSDPCGLGAPERGSNAE